MESRLATTLSSKFGDTPRTARSAAKSLSDKTLATSRNSISSQLLNVYYQQKEIALNMFDEWEHEQKINFLLSLMPRASYRQLVHVVNWFQDNIPIWSLDFTTVLPRWKNITEHDVLWEVRCVKLGWQLPFFPTENEVGAWKRYYAQNYRQHKDLGLQTPDIGDPFPPIFSTFNSNHSAVGHTRVIHQSTSLIPKLKLEVSNQFDESFALNTTNEDEVWVSGTVGRNSLVFKDKKKLLFEVAVDATPRSLREAMAVENVLERRLQSITSQSSIPPIRTPSKGISKIMATYTQIKQPCLPNPTSFSPFPASYPAWLGHALPASSNPRVLIISNLVPAAELLAISCAWSKVEAIVYDFQGSTPESLVNEIQTLLGHRMAKSFALVPSISEAVLQNGFSLTANCLVTPAALASASNPARAFFCSISALLLPRPNGGDGYVDIFAPLLMYEEGAQLLLQLNSVTGTIFHCPQTVRGDYEYLFGNSDWIVTKTSLGLLERSVTHASHSSTLQTGIKKNCLLAVSEHIPPTLYFDEKRLQFWLKSYKLVHRSIGKIRRDLARAFEYRTESCLLDRLIGQVAFDEFQGAEFSYVMSIWPEISQALMSTASSHADELVADYNEDSIEWKMAQCQQPSVAVATKLLEQAGYRVCETIKASVSEKATQHQNSLPSRQNQSVQTMSMILQAQSSNPSESKQEDTKAESSVENSALIGERTEAMNDSDSSLLIDKTDLSVFNNLPAIGEGDSHSSSGIALSEGRSNSFSNHSQDDYPLHHSSGIRTLETNENDNVPAKLDVIWTIERKRMVNDNTLRSKANRNNQESRMVYSVLFTDADRRLIAVKDLFECESRYNKILAGIQSAFVYPLNHAVFQERAILSTNNIKMLFSDIMELLDVSNEFMEALESRLDNWIDVEGQVSDVLLTFVCGRWNIFLSYMNNYPVVLETLDRCVDEQRLFRAFVGKNERSLPVGMLTMAEVFALPFDHLAAYRSHFKRILVHTDHSHLDMIGLREARKLISQYCALVQERASSHTKHSRPTPLNSSFRSIELAAPIEDIDSITSFTSQLPHFDETSTDLRLLRDCPFVLDSGSHGDRRFVCRQDLTLLRPASSHHIPFEMQLFEVVDDIGFFLFSDCLVIAKRRAIHKPYVREAEVAFYFANCVPTRDVVQVDKPDTKYIAYAVEYQAQQYKWLVCFPEQQSKLRFMAVIAPYINSQLATPFSRSQSQL